VCNQHVVPKKHTTTEITFYEEIASNKPDEKKSKRKTKLGKLKD